MYKGENPVVSVFKDDFNTRRENTELFQQGCLLVQFDEQIHTVPQMLYTTQAIFGGRLAQMFKEAGEWKTLTYTDLVFRVENLAIGLLQLGLQPGELTGIKAKTCAEWTWADLASLVVGCGTTSFHATMSQRETEIIINHSELKLLFVDKPDSLFEMVVMREHCPSLQHLVCMQKGFKGNGKDIWGLWELIDLGEASRAELLPEIKTRISALRGSDPAAMVYTSGTTGDLKGVMHSHKNICYGCSRSAKHYFNCGHVCCSDSVFMCVLPLSHIVEKCHTYYTSIAFGGLLGFAESVATLPSDYQTIRPTFQMFVPRLLSRLLLGIERAFSQTEEGKKLWDWAMDVAMRATDAIENEDGCINTNIPIPEQVSGELQQEWIKAYNMVFWRIHHFFGGRMKEMNCGGAALDPVLHRKLIGIGFFVGFGYGLTETAAGVTNSTPSASLPGWTSQVNPGVDFKLDEDGEILLRGVGIITEYYKNEAATKESFTPDGYFRTGDIGEVSHCGYIRVVDRKKTLIILDTGKNVPVSRIESLCDSRGLIEQIVVVGQDRKYIAALVVPNYDVILTVLKQSAVPYDETKIKTCVINGTQAILEVGQEVANNPFLKEALQKEIDKVNEQLETYEQIKRFRILPRRLTEENGEVTASMKLKMKVIKEKYQDEIESLYE
ncbi:MAG: AMP-binding protein [Bacillota bacterium]|nr:AMP-binding protein [Bacillota bacterium]